MPLDINRISIEDHRKIFYDFQRERNWMCFWYPRYYLLVLCGEFGELVELFEGIHENELYTVNRTKPELFELICEELSDVFVCLIALAGNAGFNLTRIALDPTCDCKVDFKREFPVTFDDGVYFDDLASKIPEKLQQLCLFDLTIRMTRKISQISTVYQWFPNEQREIGSENYVKVQIEIFEFFWCLMEVSRRFGIDLNETIQKKMLKNRLKYPI